MSEEIIEEWKDIPGYEGLYQVSSIGRVKSLLRTLISSDKKPLTVKERMLKYNTNNQGYLYYSLSKNNKIKHLKSHQLVAMAFLGHTPDGTYRIVVDHINNIKTDNRVCNLQLISHRENVNKSIKEGSSKYRGVHWNNEGKKWASCIWKGNKPISLGKYIDELEAAEMYQKALANLHLYENCPKTFREKLKNL